MNPIRKYTTGLLILVLLQLASCKKESSEQTPDPVTPEEKYALTIHISHVFGDTPFQYLREFMTAADTIKLNALAYYFTNVKLTKTDGSIVAPETYFLVNFDDPSTASIRISDLPKATYQKLSFLVGVDSTRNHSGAQTGALDPGYNMVWPWNTGYIFLRVKGKYGAANNALSLDLGGDEHIMKYDLGTSFMLDHDRTVNMKMDVKELFQNPQIYSLGTDGADIHTVTAPGIPKLVENSKDMFTILSVQ